MKLALDPRAARLLRRLPRSFPYALAEILLIALIALQAARLVWTMVEPMGPVGAWRAGGNTPAADLSLLTRFDPFFRGGDSGQVVVTSLSLKLTGVRVDEASGRGSAIIATPDGIESSYAVGDEIVPGVRLKSVAFDNVTLDRGGASEQLFLDQSTPAPLATASGAPPLPVVGVPRPPLSPLLADIAASPRPDGHGVGVSPRGSGDAFRAAGLQPGDIVTQINGVPVASATAAETALGATPQSGLITLTVERGGKTLTLNAGTGQ